MVDCKNDLNIGTPSTSACFYLVQLASLVDLNRRDVSDFSFSFNVTPAPGFAGEIC